MIKIQIDIFYNYKVYIYFKVQLLVQFILVKRKQFKLTTIITTNRLQLRVLKCIKSNFKVVKSAYRHQLALQIIKLLNIVLNLMITNDNLVIDAKQLNKCI